MPNKEYFVKYEGITELFQNMVVCFFLTYSDGRKMDRVTKILNKKVSMSIKECTRKEQASSGPKSTVIYHRGSRWLKYLKY